MRSSEQALLGAEVLQRALDPAVGVSPEEAVLELITVGEGRRAPLEAAASLLIARLHRKSDDFNATRALSSVTAALSRIGWDMSPRSVTLRRQLLSQVEPA